jgi:ADP-ribose pyrophosphatase
MSDEREVFAGRVVRLVLRGKYEIVEHAGGAAVVAVHTDGSVLLVRQHRPAVGKSLLELPAGLVDPGEQPIDCARRELEEETGYTAQRLEPLVSFYSSPGFSTELLHVFVARGLRECLPKLDEEEDIEVVRLPLERAIEQVTSGEISDAKTVTGLLAYRAISNQHWYPKADSR